MILKKVWLNKSIKITQHTQNNFAPWEFFHAFLSSVDFFISTFSKNSFRNTIRVSISLDQDQARHFARPDLSPNCLQRLSADENWR